MFKKSKPLKQPGDEEHAYNYALFLLNLRLRTEGEMRSKMEKRGYFSAIIDAVVNRLVEDRLVDDDRYAEIFIENMKSYKHYGYFMMKKKLMEKLLPKDLIEQKLDDLVSVADERKIAERYLQKELSSSMSFRTSRSKADYETESKQNNDDGFKHGSKGFKDDILKQLKKLPYEEKQKIMRRALARGFRLEALGLLK